VEKNAFVLAAFLKALFERRATAALVVSMVDEERWLQGRKSYDT